MLIGCLPLVQLVEEKRCRFRLRGTWRRGLWTNLRDKPFRQNDQVIFVSLQEVLHLQAVAYNFRFRMWWGRWRLTWRGLHANLNMAMKMNINISSL